MPATTAAAMAMRVLTTANYTDHSANLGRPVNRLVESTTPALLGKQAIETLTVATTTAASMLGAGDLFSTSSDGLADQLILNEQQAEIRTSSLYSIEEFSHWTSSESYTALIHALLASFSVILVSELGDKTFIITAIMAMKNSRSLVFISSAMALLLMTVLSVGMGVAVTVIPKLYTHYASIVLFLCFGLKMLKEAYDMELEDGDESEFDEVKRSLEEVEDKSAATLRHHQQDGPTISEKESPVEKSESASHADKQQPSRISRLVKTLYIAPVVIKVFTMVFIAEWGDRSQISTVILAAREDVVGVFVGSLSGHVLCTGLAVIGGRFVADMISVRTMTLLGGIIFLFFATFAIVTGPEAA